MDKIPDIERTFHLEAAPKEVFAALTDSVYLEKWWPVKARVDPAEGGRFSMVFQNGFVLDGKLLNFEENKSVTFSWVAGTATFELKRKGKGTSLKLHHAGIDSTESLASASSGWSYYLANLKSVLDHGADLRSKDDIF